MKLKGTLDIEEKQSIMDDGAVYDWCIYLDGEDAPWIEDGTGYPAQADALKQAKKWGKRLNIELREGKKP